MKNSCKFILYLALLILCIPVSVFSDTYFHGSGLISIPTAYIIDNGIFDAGASISIKDQKRHETALRMDFGLLNFAELGAIGLKKDKNDYVTANIKVIMARESGVLPNFAVGVDNLGENADKKIDEYDISFYAVTSKKFNLPFLHIIICHLGIGNKRYLSEDSIGKYLHGIFLGLNKEIILTSRDIRLSFMGEIKGEDANIGLRCLMKSGVILSLAVNKLNLGKNNISYNMGLSFTNASIMKELSQSMELAKQAVKIANETRSESSNIK